jgi:amino acid transporter
MLATYIAIHAAASRYVFALASEGLLPRLLSRSDETRKVPTAAVIFILVVTVICLSSIAGSHTNPYAAIIPVLIGVGTLGIIALQAAAAIAILFYVFQRRREAGVLVLILSFCAAIGLSVALGAVCANFTLLSTVSTPLVAWLPVIYLATLIAGLSFGLWLRWNRPHQYEKLTFGFHASAESL